MQKEHRQAEGALDGHLEKIRKLNEQTSLVKTNKEYQTLLGEIDVLKGQQDGYEEKILELMEKSGEVEKKIRAKAFQKCPICQKVFPGAGSELYRGVGAIVLGGLALATLLTLFVVPALFALVWRLRGVASLPCWCRSQWP